MTKQNATVLGILVLVAAGSGIAYLATRESSSGGGGDNQARTAKVYEGDPGVWWFTISQGGSILHGPSGPFANQAAAQTAGDNWLAANPVL